MISENTEEAWLKLFMLPKCVLPSTKRGGRHEKLQPKDFLCNLWANNDLTCLWNLAKGRANKLRDAPVKNLNTSGKPVDMAVSFGRCGMLGKAVALRPTMTQLGSLRIQHLKFPFSLDSSFDIGAVLRSFPKDTAAGPSGLRIQHILM